MRVPRLKCSARSIAIDKANQSGNHNLVNRRIEYTDSIAEMPILRELRHCSVRSIEASRWKLLFTNTPWFECAAWIIMDALV